MADLDDMNHEGEQVGHLLPRGVSYTVVPLGGLQIPKQSFLIGNHMKSQVSDSIWRLR